MTDKPNVLFVIIDSARVDHFSLYGYEKDTTPFLKSVAGDLMVYENANAPAAWTRPAMNSIFTGLYPEQYDFFENRYPDERTPLVSGVLKTHGYRVQLLSNNPYMSPETGFGRGADDFYFICSQQIDHNQAGPAPAPPEARALHGIQSYG